jgi:hypothetical protein
MSDFSNQDNEIIEKLAKGLEQTDPVPSHVTEFAHALFTWRNLDADLAELSYDSIDEQTPTGVRSTSTARMISFEVGQWTVDLEHNPTTGLLIGSVAPESDFTVELHIGGARFVSESDELGRFEFEGVEQGPASFVIRLADGRTLKTSWVVL